MRLGDLLVRAKLVTEKDVAKAVDRQGDHGGRLGENLVAIGAIDERVLDAFIHRIPAEPASIAATGVDEADLLSLLMKLIYTGRLETNRQFIDAIKLPYLIVLDLVQMAVDRQLLRTLGSHDSDSLIDMRYVLTEEGRRWTVDALQRLRYVGPAPVTIDEFTIQVNLQKLTNEIVPFERRQHRRTMRTGVELGPGDAAVWSARQWQILGGALPRRRVQRRDLRALRGDCGGPDHPRSRPRHSYRAEFYHLERRKQGIVSAVRGI
jgi:hypothetical protein